MVPYSYNMVDMGGIDLAEANGTVVPGVYEKITEAMNLCGDLILYNWKFAGINITPSAYTVLQQANSILINGLIQVTELDQITVIAIPPPLVPVAPLEVVENGLYEVEPPQSGFNPVQVSVPERVPIIESIFITENGIYSAPEGVDGYAPVTVNVSRESPIHSVSVISASSIFTEFQCDSEQLPSNLKKYSNVQYFGTSAGNILYSEMTAANTSATIYAVIKSLTSSGDFAGVCFAYAASQWNCPLFYTRGNAWMGGTYSNDFSTGISSNVFRVLALAVDNSTKKARFFIDDAKLSTEKQYTNSGKCAGWGGGITNAGTIALANAFDVRYGALVQGVETDAEILANMALISTQYAGILGT